MIATNTCVFCEANDVILCNRCNGTDSSSKSISVSPWMFLAKHESTWPGIVTKQTIWWNIDCAHVSPDVHTRIFDVHVFKLWWCMYVLVRAHVCPMNILQYTGVILSKSCAEFSYNIERDGKYPDVCTGFWMQTFWNLSGADLSWISHGICVKGRIWCFACRVWYLGQKRCTA